MSVFSQFRGGRPAKVEVLTGSGNWTPPFTPCLARVTLVGGGAGGSRPSATSVGQGGSAGATVYGLLRLASGTVSYVVGAGGTGGASNGAYGTSGGNTYFGGLTAAGGASDVYVSGYVGGGVTLSAETDNQVAGAKDGGLIGFSGGGGGGNSNGYPPGYPRIGGPFNGPVAGLGVAGTTSTNAGGPAGGDSVYGIGGTGGNGSATTATAGSTGNGYGSGGGSGGSGTTSGNGGNGAAGTIIVEVFPSAE